MTVWQADTAAEDRVELGSGGVGGVSDRGHRHRRNEDAMALAVLAHPVAVVAVVCDGVSSSEHPERASLAAARTAATVLVEELPGGDGDTATRAAVAAAARAAAEQAGSEAVRGPSCTYVSAVVTADAVTVGWVGDSRVYWLSDASSRKLTTDDSWTAEMVGAGLLTEEDARHHPGASVITRWLGGNAGEVDPHVVTLEPEGPGVVLVCSDGLWHYLDDAEAMAAAALPLAHQDPLAAARELTAIALDGGGHDNISVAVVPFPARAPVQA